MKIELNFDMDNTLVDLFGVDNWLERIELEDPTIYMIAKPMRNLSGLSRSLNRLQAHGVKLRVISWTAKNGSAEYNKQIKFAKIAWLKNHMPSVHWDEICIVDYGTPKHTLGEGILIDDDEQNCADWSAHGGLARTIENWETIHRFINFAIKHHKI